MPDIPPHSRSVTLSLLPEERWTFHHMLLDRIEQEATAQNPVNVDPPPVEVFQAFETLDTGGTSFTIPQLTAMQTILTEYHRSPIWWEIKRSQLEQLLHHVLKPIEQSHVALSQRDDSGDSL